MQQKNFSMWHEVNSTFIVLDDFIPLHNENYLSFLELFLYSVAIPPFQLDQKWYEGSAM